MTDHVTPVSAAEAEAFDYLRVWAECMTQVLGQIARAPFPVECIPSAPPEALPPAENDLHLIVAAGGSLRGEMSLRMPQDGVLGLAQLFLGESPDPAAEIKSDHREAVVELLRQIAGQAATAARPQWGEVQLRVEVGTLPSWAAGASGWMAAGSGAPVRLWLEWQLSAALVAELRPARERANAPPAADTHAIQSTPSPNPAPEENLTENLVPAGKIDLFMDVELDVMLRFGGKRMVLREVLQLGPGAVVELDHQVQEPADLLLDGKLIARGEVVVVDGNYGLRVLEVVPSQLPR